jgi:serine/threonine-protein kinase
MRRRTPPADAPTEPLDALSARGGETLEYERVEQRPVPTPPPEPGRGWYDEVGWALLALLILLAIGAAVWWFGFHRGTARRTVPAVTGKPVAAAVNELQALGFKVHIVSQSHREPPGTVFSEIPPAGSRVKKGSTIELLKSNGPGAVTVPNAVGLSEATARDRLVSAGFQVTETRVFGQQKAGDVIAQSPAAGSKAPKGSTVRINVSKGSATVIVPNVVGSSVGEAETTLAQHGLKGVVQLHVPSSQPAGTVVAQDPPGGQAKRNSEVKLNVSNGSGASGATGASGPTGPTGPTGPG